jgi:SAM-dependent methyltransferase
MRLNAQLKALLPFGVRHRLLWWRSRLTQWPPRGMVRFGDLRRVTPISPRFSFGRGLSVDRYYIERFLQQSAADIAGDVLEIGDPTYTKRFGGSRVASSHVLHVVEGNPQATIVADLRSGGQLGAERFDCIICTQTLQYIDDVRAAVGTLHRLLKPGGVALVSVPGISQISRYDMDRWGEYWRFTTRSAQRLFGERFSDGSVTVEAHGNVLAAVAFLHGMAADELRPAELDARDPDYEVIILVRAAKSYAHPGSQREAS